MRMRLQPGLGSNGKKEGSEESGATARRGTIGDDWKRSQRQLLPHHTDVLRAGGRRVGMRGLGEKALGRLEERDRWPNLAFDPVAEIWPATGFLPLTPEVGRSEASRLLCLLGRPLDVGVVGWVGRQGLLI